MTACLSLIASALTPLPKSALLSLGLSAGISAADAAIQKKIYGWGCPLGLASHATLIISNEEMEDIMRIVKSLEESGLLIKVISETIKNETKEQKEVLLGMLLGTLDASLLGSALPRGGVIRAGERTISLRENFCCLIL